MLIDKYPPLWYNSIRKKEVSQMAEALTLVAFSIILGCGLGAWLV
jgi:hypothetical protein